MKKIFFIPNKQIEEENKKLKLEVEKLRNKWLVAKLETVKIIKEVLGE